MNDGVQILPGDCRETLRTIAPESVLHANSVDLLGVEVKRFHCLANVLWTGSSANMAAPFCDPRFCAGRFEGPERERIQCLRALHTKERKQSFKTSERLRVSYRPRKERTPAWRARLSHVNRTAERLAQRRRDFRSHLPECCSFGIYGLPGVACSPHGVSAFLDSDSSVRVNRASKVSEKGVFHGRNNTTVTGVAL